MKTTRTIKSFATAIFLVALGLPLQAQSALINDGDFAAWSSFSFVTDDPFVAGSPPNVSSGSAAQVVTGGNPGAFLQTTHTMTTGDTIWTGGIKMDYSYDPVIDGSLAAVSVSADAKMFGGGASAWQLVVEQGGKRYFSFPLGAFSGAGWAKVTASNLSAANFDTNPWAGNSGILPDGNRPDFSSTATPLRFGFMVGNRLPGGGTLTVSHGIDNFSVNIAQGNATTLQPGPGQGKDIWTTSVYSYAPGGGGPGGGLDNDILKLGGWGDTYYSLLQFDLTTAPQQATSVILRLYNADGGGAGGTPMLLDRITQFWDWRTQGTGKDRLRLWWADKPSTIQWQATPLPTPAKNAFYDIDITSLYNAWQSGQYPNYGLQLRPTLTNNNWNQFYSSDYVGNPLQRPQLIVTSSAPPPPVLPTPTKFPLPALLPKCPLPTKAGTQCGLVLAVHGWNANSEDWPSTMAASIKSSIQISGNKNIDWVVGTLDWGVEAGNTASWWALFGDKAPWTAWSNGDAIGQDLAKAIAGSDGTYDHVHLIAHSAGSRVIQVATETLKARTDIKLPKIHLTFFDAYHPANMSTSLYDFSTYGEKADWAEQYVDKSIFVAGLRVFGTDTILRGAFNFDITGWSVRPFCFSGDLACVHRWPSEWYQDSVNFSSSTAPYKYGYSRSIEADNKSLPSDIFKPGLPPCLLEDTSSLCVPTFSPVLTTLKFFPQAVFTTSTRYVTNTYKSVTGFVSDVKGVINDVGIAIDIIRLLTGSPVWVTYELDLPMDISGLQFDYQFGGTGEGLLTVYLDDQRVHAADQRNGTGVNKTAGPFTVGAVSAGKHFLSFRLDNFDGPPSSVDLSAITFGNFALEPLLNVPPIAVAGEYQTVRAKSNVTLNGGGSYDPDSTASSLDFKWWQVGGPAITLSSPTAALPQFTPLAPGKYAFNLLVNDGLIGSFPASVVISVPTLGDIDLDGDVDTDDLAKINAALNQAASGPNDLRDIDGDGKITALDSRKLVTLCTRPRCVTR